MLAGNFPNMATARGGADVLSRLFQTYMSPEALKNYDAIAFVSTTGLLPIPDEKAFLDWVAAGHPVIALHAAMDRGATSDAQMDMLSGGARFGYSDCIPVFTHIAARAFAIKAFAAIKRWISRNFIANFKSDYFLTYFSDDSTEFMSRNNWKRWRKLTLQNMQISSTYSRCNHFKNYIFGSTNWVWNTLNRDLSNSGYYCSFQLLNCS